jgi:hypothetical protein
MLSIDTAPRSLQALDDTRARLHQINTLQHTVETKGEFLLPIVIVSI